MKKIMLLFSLVATQFNAFSQDINGGMEQWRNYTSGFLPPVRLEAPNGWYGLDSLIVFGAQMLQLSGGGNINISKQVHKSDDAHNGNYAAKIVSITIDTFGVVPGVLSNARIDLDLAAVMAGDELMNSIQYTGGTPINSRVEAVEAWLKYETTGSDSATMAVAAVLSGQAADGTDSVVGVGFAIMGSTSQYVSVSAPVIYTDNTTIPDKLIIGFVSSASQNATDGSALYIDDVKIISNENTQVYVMPSNAPITCFPNPTNGMIYLRGMNQPTTWSLYDLAGRQVHQTTWSGTATVDCTMYPMGTYLYRITDQLGNTLSTGNIIIKQ